MIGARPVAVLVLLACAAALATGSCWSALRERIAAAQRAERATLFADILPRGHFDNFPGDDTVRVEDPALLGFSGPRTAYIARRDGRIEALVLPVRVPQAYAGPMELLLGIDRHGRISGVRLLAHHETPGLGQQIESGRSDWLQQFRTRALDPSAEQRWALRRDGGDFDQLTGASVTSRAVTLALKCALQYVAAHPALFEPHTGAAHD